MDESLRQKCEAAIRTLEGIRGQDLLTVGVVEVSPLNNEEGKYR
jgi:hypothetical protein